MWRMIVIAVLVTTAAAKLLSLVNPTPLLNERDVILRMSMSHAVLLAGVLELALAGLVWRAQRQRTAAIGVILFSAAILFYRVTAYTNGITHCPCMGNVANWWPWLGRHEGPILLMVACWLLITSIMEVIVTENPA